MSATVDLKIGVLARIIGGISDGRPGRLTSQAWVAVNYRA